MTQSITTPTGKHGWRHYTLPTGSVVPFYDSRGLLLESGTTGLCSWPAAWCLAEYGYHRAEWFKTKSILEIGSGIGLGGILLAALTHNQQPIYLTDVHNEVLQICEINAKAINDVLDTNVLVSELDWCSYDRSALCTMLRQVDVVIGADIFYDASLFAPLSAMLRDMLDVKPELDIFLSATMRNKDTWSSFLKACKTQSLSVNHLTTSDELESAHSFDYDRTIPINIVHIRRIE